MSNINNLWWKRGLPHPIKGKKLPRTSEWEANRIAGLMGHKTSENTKKKISKSQSERALRGELSPMWKGGNKSITQQVRCRCEYKHWRQHIYWERGYICANCKKVGGEIELHHKIPLSEIVRINKFKTVTEAINNPQIWDESNVEILCKPCHKKTYSYLRYKKPELIL